MDMAMRVGGAASIVGKERVDEIAGAHRHVFATDVDPGFGEILLGPGHRLFDGLHVRREDPFVPRHQREERSRLRHRECEVAATIAGGGVADLRPVGKIAIKNALEGYGVVRQEERSGGKECVCTGTSCVGASALKKK